MSSAWVEHRSTSSGVRYRVRYRVGGRESKALYGGSFRTMTEATARREWIAGELAAMRVPDIHTFAAPAAAVTAERSRPSRDDVENAAIPTLLQGTIYT